MTQPDWIWLGVIGLIALLILRAAGNAYDNVIGNPIPARWPPAAGKYWWRWWRRRCQICGGPLKGSAVITREHSRRLYRVCNWCIRYTRRQRGENGHDV